MMRENSAIPVFSVILMILTQLLPSYSIVMGQGADRFTTLPTDLYEPLVTSTATPTVEFKGIPTRNDDDGEDGSNRHNRVIQTAIPRDFVSHSPSFNDMDETEGDIAVFRSHQDQIKLFRDKAERAREQHEILRRNFEKEARSRGSLPPNPSNFRGDEPSLPTDLNFNGGFYRSGPQRGPWMGPPSSGMPISQYSQRHHQISSSNVFPDIDRPSLRGNTGFLIDGSEFDDGRGFMDNVPIGLGGGRTMGGTFSSGYQSFRSVDGNGRVREQSFAW